MRASRPLAPTPVPRTARPPHQCVESPLVKSTSSNPSGGSSELKVEVTHALAERGCRHTANEFSGIPQSDFIEVVRRYRKRQLLYVFCLSVAGQQRRVPLLRGTRHNPIALSLVVLQLNPSRLEERNGALQVFDSCDGSVPN